MNPDDYDSLSDSDCDIDPLVSKLGGATKYIVESDLHDFFCFDNKIAINMLHINARSMKSNFQGIESLLSNVAGTLTAIAITETWLTSDTEDVYFIPGYNFIPFSRSTVGGGVGIFLQNSLNYFIRKDACRMLHYLECIFVEISQVGKANFIIGCIYRPSNSKSNADINLFLSEFKKILSILDNGGNKTVFLAGDYNLDLLNCKNNTNAGDFLNNLLSYAYLPSINCPTRISDHSSTLLDNIFIRSRNINFESTIIFNDISDHLPIAIHSIDGLQDQKGPVRIKKRIFDSHSIEDFNNALNTPFIWDEVNAICNVQNDPNAAYNCFLKIYSLAFNNFFPEKYIKLSRKKVPINEWMTKGLLKSCNTKSKLYKKYKKSKSPIDKEQYIVYRNKLKMLILKTKKNYYFTKFKTFSGSLRHTWKLLGSIVKNKLTLDISKTYLDNDRHLTDKLEIVNKFNEYFVNIQNVCDGG